MTVPSKGIPRDGFFGDGQRSFELREARLIYGTDRDSERPRPSAFEEWGKVITNINERDYVLECSAQNRPEAWWMLIGPSSLSICRTIG